MTTREAPGEQRFAHLDYIRVVCILYVIAYWHLSGYVKHQDDRYWLGTIMVVALGVFTMISGYLVHRRGWPPSAWRFLARRFLRLYPLFAIAVALFVVFGMVDGPTAIRSLLLVSMIYPPAPVTLWFVVMLLDFYLAYALVAWLRKYSCQWVVYAVIVAGLVLCNYFVHEVDARLLEYGPAFALGVVLAAGIVKRKYLLIPALAVFAASMAFLITRTLGHTLRSILLVLSAGYLLMTLGEAAHRPNRFDAVVRQLAFASYAMYLFHRPVYKSLLRLWTPASHEMRYVYLLTAGLVITIGISWVVQTLYDRGVEWAAEGWARAGTHR
jgi:peptidoglycan/LPS O-acetylase OafA/YrhL